MVLTYLQAIILFVIMHEFERQTDGQKKNSSSSL